jgi:8-oxo-dGTP pyrophosphatase MutT (NUDIX family)
MVDLPSRLREQLRARAKRIRPEWEAVPAAVLVPLYQDADRWHVLFTRRTESVDSHRGQVSFPGGRIEVDDAGPEAAALREAQEEIGLSPDTVDVLGTLDSLLTVTQFLVTPVVGVIPWPSSLRLNREEVAVAFGVDLDWLADPANLEVRQRQLIAPGPSVPVYYYRPYENEVIWGATARIMLDLLDALGRRKAQR